MKKIQFLFGICMIILISVNACIDYDKFEKLEREEIESYLANNKAKKFIKKESGLYYLEIVEGTGIAPADNDTAYVKYTGMFLNGDVFQSFTDDDLPHKIMVGSLSIIQGFSEGLKYMKEGGKATILIPSSLAYGITGDYYVIDGNIYPISGYTPLLFDIELIEVKKAVE